MKFSDPMLQMCVMPDAETLRAANINPATGLATDFLNPFNEYVMMVELVIDGSIGPEALAEWQPVDYEGHFAGSGFAGAKTVLIAYRALDPAFRQRFEAAVIDLVDAILDHQREVANCCGELALIRAGRDTVANIISQTGRREEIEVHPGDAQASIDALFD